MEENRQELCVAIFCIFTRLGGKENKTLFVPKQLNMESKGGRNQHPHCDSRLGEALLLISQCISDHTTLYNIHLQKDITSFTITTILLHFPEP